MSRGEGRGGEEREEEDISRKSGFRSVLHRIFSKYSTARKDYKSRWKNAALIAKNKKGIKVSLYFFETNERRVKYIPASGCSRNFFFGRNKTVDLHKKNYSRTASAESLLRV